MNKLCATAASVLIYLLTALPSYAAGLDDFVITVQTDQTFTIPINSDFRYNYNVDCNNDGNNEASLVIGPYSCFYREPGRYQIRIEDNTGRNTGFPAIRFYNSGESQKLLAIDQWGSGLWSSMAFAFHGCSNLINIDTIGAPDLSQVTDMTGMFFQASKFNQSIKHWDTSNVTDMTAMFFQASAFNQNIAGWDTSNVTDMRFLFYQAEVFNQNIGQWNTGSVTDMTGMFLGAEGFNQDISDWKTDNVTTMNSMFFNAYDFDLDIGSWDIRSVTDMGGMFYGVTLATENYDALLQGWIVSEDGNPLQNDVPFHAGHSTYCRSETARDVLRDSYNWTITDGGKNCNDLLKSVRTLMKESLSDVEYDSSPTPYGPLGTLTLDFNFEYTGGPYSLNNLVIEATQANDATLINADTGPGGVGSILSIDNSGLPNTINPGQELFDPSETLSTTLEVGINQAGWALDFTLSGVENGAIAAKTASKAPDSVRKFNFTIDSSMLEDQGLFGQASASPNVTNNFNTNTSEVDFAANGCAIGTSTNTRFDPMFYLLLALALTGLISSRQRKRLAN